MSDPTIYGTMAGGAVQGVSLADTPRQSYRPIYDDELAAVPMDGAPSYDLGTCHEKHARMTAYQARRIDELWAVVTDQQLRIRELEETIRDWSAGK